MFLTNFSFDAHFPNCSLKIFKKKKLETSLEARFFFSNTIFMFTYILCTGIANPCIHLLATPSTSTHLHPVHFSLQAALCNILNIVRTKISHVIGQFP